MSQELPIYDGVKKDSLNFQSKSIACGFLQTCNKSLYFTMNSTCVLCSDVIYEVQMHSLMETMRKFRLFFSQGVQQVHI